MTLQEKERVDMLVEEYMSEVLPPEVKKGGFTEKIFFETAVEEAVDPYAESPFAQAMKDGILEALRAKWPKEVEAILMKAAVA